MRARKVHLTRGLEWAPLCGNREARELAMHPAAVSCEQCLMINAGTWGLGRRHDDVKACGSIAALRRHRRRGELVDQTCRQAESRDNKDRNAARQIARLGGNQGL